MDTVRIVRDENGRDWINVNQKEVQRRALEAIWRELEELASGDYKRDLETYWHLEIAERIDETSAIVYESPADHHDGTWYSHKICTSGTLVTISADKAHCGLNGTIQLTKAELKEISDILDLVPISYLQARLIRGWTAIYGELRNRHKDSISHVKENAFTIASALRCARRFCELLDSEAEVKE